MKEFLPLLFSAALASQPLCAQTSELHLPPLSLSQSKGEMLLFTRQVDMGKLLPGAQVSATVDYPVFERLSSADVKRLKAMGVTPSGTITPQVQLGGVRGRTLADVSFMPVVRRGRHWYALREGTLRLESSDSRLPRLLRTAAHWQAKAASAQRYASSSVLSTGKWVKIGVKTEGVYQLTHAQLKRMGFDDPSRVKLYGYGGRPLPESFVFSGPDALIDDLNEVPLYRRDGSVLFFAEGTVRRLSNGKHKQSPYATTSCYFLTEGDSPLAFSTLEEPTGAGTEVTHVVAQSVIDHDGFCWYEGGRDFYESEQLSSAKNYTLSLPGLDYPLSAEGEVATKAQVSWDVGNANSTSSATVALTNLATGHVLSRGTVPLTKEEGVTAHGYRATFSTDELTEGDNRLRVTSTDPSARLDYIRVNYPQRLSATNPQASFSPEVYGGVTLKVENATSTTAVWQLPSGNAQAAALPAHLEGNTLSASTRDGQQRFVIVDTGGNYPSPETIGSVPNQNLHADAGIQYVVIVPTSGILDEQAERLAEFHRTHDGLTAKVVHAGDIYNEFSSGTPDATAYRRYLKMLYDRAMTDEERPRYLVLFGDCAWDNRGVTADWRSLPHDDYLLSYERSTQETKSNTSYSIGTLVDYVTDDYYGMLDDSEGATITTDKLDLGIGRFPCHDAATARLLVDRTLRYAQNESTGAWKNSMYSIADYGDENLHMEDAEAVFNQARTASGGNLLQRRLYLDSYSVVKTSKGATYPAATAKLQQIMQQGALVFNYNGHGSPDRLSHAFLLDKADMTSNVSQALPLWIYASCEISPYDQQVADMARNSLYNEEGGSVAVICAARSVYAHSNRALDLGLMKYLFAKDVDGRRLTFGDALQRSKVELVTVSSSSSSASTIGTDRTENKLKFALLGDPALTLGYADDGLRIDSIDGKWLQGNAMHTLAAGQTVRFSGCVAPDGTPDESFNGVLTATLFGPAETVTCKGYGNTSKDPQTYSELTRMLYQGTVNVHNGRFSIDVLLPRSVQLSSQPSLLSLYAVSDDRQRELKGREGRFCVNVAGGAEQSDSIGPKTYLYFDRPDFPDGGVVDVNATFYAAISDSSAISVASGSLGHDMELVVDGDASSAVRLNDYFSFSLGSYTEGLVTYPMKNLSPGKHTLSFRAWDVFDNSTTTQLRFTVREGGGKDFDVVASDATPRLSTRFITSFIRQAEGDVEVLTEVYNLAGMRVWSSGVKVNSGEYASVDWSLTDYSGRRLQPGVYFYRSKVNGKETKTKKILIL